MTVFLTGGSGFFGQALARALAAAGREVRVLVRPESDTRILAEDRVQTVLGDLMDPSTLRAGMTGCRTVVHAAALTEPGKGREYEAANIQGFRNVMDAAWGLKVPQVVHVSCSVLLGPTGGLEADEDHISAGRRGVSDHERSKAVADQLCSSYLSGGIPLSIVYPTMLYGPGPLRTGNLISRLLLERAKGALPDHPGEERICLAYVDDAATGVVKMLERGRPGDRFILGGENVTYRALLESMAGAGAPNPSKGFLGRLFGRGSTPAAKQLLEHLKNDWAYSSARAEKSLGYRCRPLREGLRKTVEHLRRKGHF